MGDETNASTLKRGKSSTYDRYKPYKKASFLVARILARLQVFASRSTPLVATQQKLDRRDVATDPYELMRLWYISSCFKVQRWGFRENRD